MAPLPGDFGRRRRRSRKPRDDLFLACRDQRADIEIGDRRAHPEAPGSARPCGPRTSSCDLRCDEDARAGRAGLAGVLDAGIDEEGQRRSRSASANTSCGDLPPSSSVTGTTFSPRPACTSLPTPTEPVKEMWSTPGCAVSAAPASSPSPGTTLSAPVGQAGFVAISAKAMRGEAGFLGRLQHRGIAHRRAQPPTERPSICMG